jgi:dethiobiotin synthetase
MHPKGLFVTGTDTGVGKTQVTLALMAGLQVRGVSVVGMKPVATGCQPSAGGLRCDDALRLLAQGSVPVPYDWLNPYAFCPPIAPSIAAQEAGIVISLSRVQRCFARLADLAQRVVVEGVGGWKAPLGDASVADMAAVLKMPIILVVGIRLGCLNHALLTCDSIAAAGCRLAGWVANQTEPSCLRLQENIGALRQRISAPMLGWIPYLPSAQPAEAALQLDVEPLLSVTETAG